MKIIVSFLLLLTLSSCSSPSAKIVAVVENGKIIFHAREQGFIIDKIFGWDDDLYLPFDTYTISVDDKIYWQFSGKNIPDDQRIFPLTYGMLPNGGKQIIKSAQLRRGIEYEIEMTTRSGAGRNLPAEGWFEITPSGSIINF